MSARQCIEVDLAWLSANPRWLLVALQGIRLALQRSGWEQYELVGGITPRFRRHDGDDAISEARRIVGAELAKGPHVVTHHHELEREAEAIVGRWLVKAVDANT